MARIVAVLQYAFANFGPLIIFYVAQHFFNLKLAILISVLFTMAEVAIRRARRKPISRFLVFSAAMTLIFGIIDLSLKESVFFKFEASATNLIFGFYFGATLLGEKTLIQDFYEQRAGAKKPVPSDLIQFFKIMTLIWVTYFFAKAVFYFWIANHYSIEEALVIRGTIGSASLYALILLSTLFGRRLYLLFKKFGIISAPAEIPAKVEPN